MAYTVANTLTVPSYLENFLCEAWKLPIISWPSPKHVKEIFLLDRRLADITLVNTVFAFRDFTDAQLESLFRSQFDLAGTSLCPLPAVTLMYENRSE